VAAPYESEAFFVAAGRCFRLVSSGDEAGPTHCPDPAVWRGRFKARDGRWYTVDACDGHYGPLQDVSPIRPLAELE
jgi:hypothetical protein